MPDNHSLQHQCAPPILEEQTKSLFSPRHEQGRLIDLYDSMSLFLPLCSLVSLILTSLLVTVTTWPNALPLVPM